MINKNNQQNAQSESITILYNKGLLNSANPQRKSKEKVAGAVKFLPVFPMTEEEKLSKGGRGRRREEDEEEEEVGISINGGVFFQ